MLEFVRNHAMLVLSILGGVLVFMATFTELVFKHKPVLLLAIVAVLGFAVTTTYQIFSYSEAREKSRHDAVKDQIRESARLARDNVIEEINLNFQQSRITVNQIADRRI